MTDLRVRGILGENFLEHFDLLIDYAQGIVCLDDTKQMQDKVKGAHIELVAPPLHPERNLSFTERLIVPVPVSGRLGISRTSMVNIEAGRQRTPLHVLWQIAELLETKLTLLIPTPEDLLAPQNQTGLDREMMKQIEEVANGDPATIKVLTGFVTKKLRANINKPSDERKAHGKTQSRRKS